MPETRSDSQATARIDAALLDRPVRADDLAIAPPDGCGGEAVFLGRTRAERHPEHGDLAALHYDAYAPMAERVLARIATEAASASGALAIVVRHSTGRVAIGEASVGVAALAGHRGGAFEACRAVIDRLKAEAPIWKREEWAGGATWQAGRPVDAEENAR
jgi:molybdopterin synthase catalytic subunit